MCIHSDFNLLHLKPTKSQLSAKNRLQNLRVLQPNKRPSEGSGYISITLYLEQSQTLLASKQK